ITTAAAAVEAIDVAIQAKDKELKSDDFNNKVAAVKKAKEEAENQFKEKAANLVKIERDKADTVIQGSLVNAADLNGIVTGLKAVKDAADNVININTFIQEASLKNADYIQYYNDTQIFSF